MFVRCNYYVHYLPTDLGAGPSLYQIGLARLLLQQFSSLRPPDGLRIYSMGNARFTTARAN